MSRKRTTVGFGAAADVKGRLVSTTGTPISGATIKVHRALLRHNSRSDEIAELSTAADGTFAYRVAPGASRRLTLSYSAFANDPAPVASTELTVETRAGVSLTVSPKRVRNGSVATFRGRLRGGPGQRRTLISIYAVTNGSRSRIPVETVAADRRGRFIYRYRFRSIAAHGTFRFQAVVPNQSGYPYAAGKSSIRAVRARP